MLDSTGYYMLSHILFPPQLRRLEHRAGMKEIYVCYTTDIEQVQNEKKSFTFR